MVYDYTGKKQASTWDGTPASAPARPARRPTDQLQVGPGPNGQAGALDGLAGIPIGSRVLVELPASKDDKGKTVNAFAVIDILNSFPAAKPTTPQPSTSGTPSN